MQILPLQKEMINASKPIVICANARGVGQTTGLLLKVIRLFGYYTKSCREDLEVVTFLSPTHWECKHALCKIIELCEDMDIEYQHVKRDDSVFLGENNFRVFFKYEVENTPHLKPDYLMVESPHLFADSIKELITRNYKQVFFTTTPYECGWRDPQFEHGDIVLDKNGDMVCNKESWDSFLINWKPLNTRASVNDYKDFVQVITGYGYEDNVYLDNNYHTVCSGLNPSDQYRLNGTWKEGVDIAEGYKVGG